MGAVMRLIPSFLSLAVLVGCANTVPEQALQLSPDSLQRRYLQTRVFETKDEAELLAACAGLLQDHGFNLDESEVELGILVGSKKRDATEAGQVIASVALAMIGVMTFWEDEQLIRASVVTREMPERNGYAVRLTMQRVIWNTQGQIVKTEPLDDPDLYRDFFGKLSKAVFLEAQGL
jgi:hypothetical protein